MEFMEGMASLFAFAFAPAAAPYYNAVVPAAMVIVCALLGLAAWLLSTITE